MFNSQSLLYAFCHLHHVEFQSLILTLSHENESLYRVYNFSACVSFSSTLGLLIIVLILLCQHLISPTTTSHVSIHKTVINAFYSLSLISFMLSTFYHFYYLFHQILTNFSLSSFVLLLFFLLFFVCVCVYMSCMLLKFFCLFLLFISTYFCCYFS